MRLLDVVGRGVRGLPRFEPGEERQGGPRVRVHLHCAPRQALGSLEIALGEARLGARGGVLLAAHREILGVGVARSAERRQREPLRVLVARLRVAERGMRLWRGTT